MGTQALPPAPAVEGVVSVTGAPIEPRFGVCSATTYNTDFAYDVATYSDLGIEGMGIWEYKLADRDVHEAAELFAENGLTATFCFPNVPGMIYSPGLFPEPKDPRERLVELQKAIRKFALFKPTAVACLAGDSSNFDEDEARAWTVEGLREAAFTAGEEGVRLTLEVIRPRDDGTGFARTIPEALELISDIGVDNIDLMVDTWHVWDSPSAISDIQEYGDSISAVQVNDRLPSSEGWWDRVLPGDGEMDLVSILGALTRAGYDGWYELEIFSDDGTFDKDLGERSLWRLDPKELLERGRDRFVEVWSRVEATNSG